MALSLQVAKDVYAVCQLHETVPVLSNQGFVSLTRTHDEISLVCMESVAPDNVKVIEKGWRLLQITGTLAFSDVGIIAKISTVLANANVSIFVLSTYNTDYLLVKNAMLHIAIQVLKDAGYSFVDGEKQI